MTSDIHAAKIDHYNKTFDMTWKLWEQRNRTFVLLLVAISVAIVFINQDFLSDVMGIMFKHAFSDNAELNTRNIPYQIFHSFMLVLVFYLLVNLYHRSASVLRGYRYLGLLESEIRTDLKLPKSDAAFTREGDFYWKHRPKFFGVVKYLYIIIIGFALALFYYLRIHHDLIEGGIVLIADGVVGLLTLTVFLAYAAETLGLDQPYSSTKA